MPWEHPEWLHRYFLGQNHSPKPQAAPEGQWCWLSFFRDIHITDTTTSHEPPHSACSTQRVPQMIKLQQPLNQSVIYVLQLSKHQPFRVTSWLAVRPLQPGCNGYFHIDFLCRSGLVSSRGLFLDFLEFGIVCWCFMTETWRGSPADWLLLIDRLKRYWEADEARQERCLRQDSGPEHYRYLLSSETGAKWPLSKFELNRWKRRFGQLSWI